MAVSSCIIRVEKNIYERQENKFVNEIQHT